MELGKVQLYLDYEALRSQAKKLLRETTLLRDLIQQHAESILGVNVSSVRIFAHIREDVWGTDIWEDAMAGDDVRRRSSLKLDRLIKQFNFFHCTWLTTGED